MRTIAVWLCLAAAWPRGLGAQELLTVDAACAYTTEVLEDAVYSFPADRDIELRVRRIDPRPVERGLEVRAANVPVAAAVRRGGRLLLLYNQYGFATMRDDDPGRWSQLAVLAHQVGHIALDHTLGSDPATRRVEELAADRYSAAALRRLGASRQAVETALASAASGASALYPAIEERIAAARGAWEAPEPSDPVEAGPANPDVPPNTEYASAEDDVPRFHWPPPRPSARDHLPWPLLVRDAGRRRLQDVAERLEEAFRQAGYVDRSYYAVPSGFALVSQLEQINPDGTPKTGDERWAVEVAPELTFSLGSYLRALLTASAGRFRVVVFVVTSQPIAHGTEAVDFSVARDWLWSGLDRLPPSIGIVPLTGDHACTALIYEFEHTGTESEGRLKSPSAISGRQHLERANILPALAP